MITKDLIPNQINVNTVHFCNYRCIYCHFFSRELSPNKRRIKTPKFYLRNDDFKKQLDIILPYYSKYHLKPTIALTGMGEPCLNPEFKSIISTLEKSNAYFNVLTNYSSATTPYIERMINCGVSAIHTDLDAGCKKTYESICPGANFETTIKNIERTSQYINRTGSKSHLNVNFILTRTNQNEVLKFIDLMCDAGVKIATLKLGAALEFKEYNIFFNDIHKQSEMINCVKEAMEYSKKKGLILHTHNYLKFLTGEDKRSLEEILATPAPCPGAEKAIWLNFVPMEAAEETILGNIGMYCHLRQDHKYRWFGNIHKDNFEDILCNQTRLNLIQGMFKNKHNEICSTCEYQYFNLMKIIKEKIKEINCLVDEANILFNKGSLGAAKRKYLKALNIDKNNQKCITMLNKIEQK